MTVTAPKVAISSWPMSDCGRDIGGTHTCMRQTFDWQSGLGGKQSHGGTSSTRLLKQALDAECVGRVWITISDSSPIFLQEKLTMLYPRQDVV